MTLVKICGVCDPADAVAAVEAGADLVGMHFCSSARRIDPEVGAEVARAVAGRAVVVGVFIDADPAEVELVAAQVGLDAVQLHGAEPPGQEYTRPVIKALKVRDGVLPDPGGWPDPVLLDSWSADGRGGTGRSWDWGLALPLTGRRQVLIAGGLNPANAGAVVRLLRPYGVDVSSGVEAEPRKKDVALMRAFVEAVRDADADG